MKGRYNGIDILSENFSHLLPVEVGVEDALREGSKDGESITQTLESSTWRATSVLDCFDTFADDLDNTAGGAIGATSDVELLEFALQLQDLHDALPNIIDNARLAADDGEAFNVAKSLLQKLLLIQEINQSWQRTDAAFLALDHWNNGVDPDAGLWLSQYFTNTAEVTMSDNVQPNHRLCTTRMVVPQGGVCILEHWRKELNGVVSDIEQAVQNPSRVLAQRAFAHDLYKASSTGCNTTFAATGKAAGLNIRPTGAVLATSRQHVLKNAETLAKRLGGGQTSFSPPFRNHIVVETFIKAAVIQAGDESEFMDLKALFL